MDKLKGMGLEVEEARFVLSEFTGLSHATEAQETAGHEVRFLGVPEDCTSESIMQWHSESGLSAESLVAVQINDERPAQGERRRSSIVCTYSQPSDAEKAFMTLQDSTLVSPSGKSSRVSATLVPDTSAAEHDAGGSSTVSDAAAGEKRDLDVTSTKEGSVSLKKQQTLNAKTALTKTDAAPGDVQAAPSFAKSKAAVRDQGVNTMARSPSISSDKQPAREVAEVPGKQRRVSLQGGDVSDASPTASRALLPAERIEPSQQAQTNRKLDLLDAENKKLKVCLEELQAKLRQLVGNCNQKGLGEEVSKIANSVGLERLLACPSRFEILYQDAFERIERLEELRKRTHSERRRLLEGSALEEASEAGPSVLTVVERSPLVILQQLVSDGPVGFSLTGPSGSPKRWKKAKPAPGLQPIAASAAAPASGSSRAQDVLLPLVLPKNLATSASAPSLPRAEPFRRASLLPSLNKHTMEGKKLLV